MVFDSGQTSSGRAYRDCISSAHAHGVPIIYVKMVAHDKGRYVALTKLNVMILPDVSA
jgi:hypothetical protein